jgi:DNA mismatch endonuclease (patch repair protein)
MASSPGVALRMSRQRQRDTAPETTLRQELHSRGHRYRLGIPVPGVARRTIDIAFTRVRVAVFVDGCFWHACPAHGTAPKANGEWWSEKLARNVWRDGDTDKCLESEGWRVVRVWEHEAVSEAADRIETVLRSRRA